MIVRYLVASCFVVTALICKPAAAQWSTNGVKVYYNSGNVGIGTSNPSFSLDVRSATTRAVCGIANPGTGTTYGVFGQSKSNSGRGVHGWASAPSGSTRGVYGRADSPKGAALFGLANSNSGKNFGVYAQTNSNSGYAGYFQGGKNYFSGPVGIGTTTPTQKLHVAGNLRVTGWIGTDNVSSVNLFVNSNRALKLQPATNLIDTSPHVIGGSDGNGTSGGIIGAAIGGGGTRTAANHVAGNFGAILGGLNNHVGNDYACIGGGSNNQADGLASIIAGGLMNSTTGDYSFAAGLRAQADHHGAFVWADANDFDFASTADDEFSVRSVGGARFVSAINGSGVPTNGVELAPGAGAWASLSDREAKENFQAIDGRQVLEKLCAIPVTSWNYKSQDESIRHIGPTAQDFRAAFQVGENEKRITTIDADGVALAAIQGLNQVVREKEAQIAALQKCNDDLQARLARLEAMMNKQIAND